MIIIEPSFSFDPFNYLDMLKAVEKKGRTAYKSESKGDPDAFIEKIIRRGHESVLEHVYLSATIVCDRGVSHEIVRHRLASYTQESTRYCNYAKQDHITVIKPCFLDEIKPGEYNAIQTINMSKARYWYTAMLTCEAVYLSMIKEGCSPQEARSVLPNSLKTEIEMTCNIREWRHFFRLRTSIKAHPQMREIACPMLDFCYKHMPVFFRDITPEVVRKGIDNER